MAEKKNNATKKIEVLQSENATFKNYDPRSFDIKDYEITFVMQVPAKSKDHAILTTIFSELQDVDCMRSLSTSDLIRIDGRLYYVQDNGFKKLEVSENPVVFDEIPGSTSSAQELPKEFQMALGVVKEIFKDLHFEVKLKGLELTMKVQDEADVNFSIDEYSLKM